MATKNGRAAGEKIGKTDDFVGMDQAITIIKTSRPTFYRWLHSGRIKGMKLGRQWRFRREDLDRFLRGEGPRVELRGDITPLIRTLMKRAGLKRRPEDGDKLQAVVDLMIALGVQMKATDIHVSPRITENGSGGISTLRYRVDGVLQTIADFDLRLHPAVIEKWKTVSGCDIHGSTLPQDGRAILHLKSPVEKTIDLRVSFLATSLGESMTARVLDSSQVSFNLGTIDYSPGDRKKIHSAIRSPAGMILVTGPTGSGKTTTLYSCLNEIASPGIKIMTVEDPVEYHLPWALQTQVQEKSGLTFPVVMRAILRSAPNVILVGEIRDRQTVASAIGAALTGHLIFANLHADDAAAALKRMVDLGPNTFTVSDATRLVIAQRLVRTICPHCSKPAKLSRSQDRRAGEIARTGGLDWDNLEKKFRVPVGCGKCSFGFTGRTVIAETLVVTSEIGEALRRRAETDELRAIAVKKGMTTMAADGVRRAAAGDVDLREIVAALDLRE